MTISRMMRTFVVAAAVLAIAISGLELSQVSAAPPAPTAPTGPTSTAASQGRLPKGICRAPTQSDYQTGRMECPATAASGSTTCYRVNEKSCRPVPTTTSPLDCDWEQYQCPSVAAKGEAKQCWNPVMTACGYKNGTVEYCIHYVLGPCSGPTSRSNSF